MKEYPEIDRLKNYFKAHTIKIKKGDRSVRSDFFLVELTIDSDSWELYIDDEYKDFSEENPLMGLFLALNSLEIYAESDDYLTWAKENNLNSSDMYWLAYFKSLDKIYKQIERSIGKIDSCISQYDYNLRMGIVQQLENGFGTTGRPE